MKTFHWFTNNFLNSGLSLLHLTFLSARPEGWKLWGGPCQKDSCNAGMCFPLAHGFKLCPRWCRTAWCHGFWWLPGFATQECPLIALAGGPFLPCSLIRKAFCSPTWLQELASQHLCILMPLSCHPRGLQSMFPFIAVGFINQGTKTGMSAQWLQLFLVSLWGHERDYCDVTSSFQEHLIRVGLCCPLCGFHLLDRPALISTRFLSLPFSCNPTKQLHLLRESPLDFSKWCSQEI